MEYVLKFTQRSQTFKRYDIRIYQDREIYLIKFQQTLLTFLTSFKLHPFVSGKKFRWNSRLQHPISRMLAENGNVNRVFQSFFPRSLPRFTHSISIGKIEGGGKCWIPRGCFRFGTWWCDPIDSRWPSIKRDPRTGCLKLGSPLVEGMNENGG